MGLLTGTLGFALVAAIAGLCYLLANRKGPFQPGSFLSTALGLDQAYVGASSDRASSSSTSSSTTATAGATTSSTTTATPTAPLYSTVNGADMGGNDIPPDVSQPGTLAQPTYSATGCQGICSSNNSCRAAVYQPSTQLCWMKSAVLPGSVTATSDRVFMPQGTPGTGQAHANGQYSGNTLLSLKLPSATDCSSLCAGLPWSSCQASVFSPDGTCNIMNTTSGLTQANAYTSWGKNYPASG